MIELPLNRIHLLLMHIDGNVIDVRLNKEYPFLCACLVDRGCYIELARNYPYDSITFR